MKSKLAYTDNSSQKELLYPNDKDILEKDPEQTQQEDTPLSYREDWEDMISD